MSSRLSLLVHATASSVCSSRFSSSFFSLFLLVLEAGIDIDLTTLKLVGTRGVTVAVVGAFLPVAIASMIALILGYKTMTAVAAGCVFASTSLGIVMNIMRQSHILNTPVGQLIVAAAIIDDLIARKCCAGIASAFLSYSRSLISCCSIPS